MSSLTPAHLTFTTTCLSYVIKPLMGYFGAPEPVKEVYENNHEEQKKPGLRHNLIILLVNLTKTT